MHARFTQVPPLRFTALLVLVILAPLAASAAPLAPASDASPTMPTLRLPKMVVEAHRIETIGSHTAAGLAELRAQSRVALPVVLQPDLPGASGALKTFAVSPPETATTRVASNTSPAPQVATATQAAAVL